ncbi:haloacid dehalogenase type II [Paeniroseomonas aquatica]|uniref:Haloacid dehalogenase type II n=1 Tax=Paeniroseomonas aquatica TaxID=373043 RepID=A0ABT8A424_9PROT|nr:haloacid dehalogenase type II [Paeniroseomonas aquatica]MDN3564425.1 haloacid dehalogenase type II [Paeniroseomonas aquatica]
MRLTDFKVLTFDCYGTLIDWESGIFAALQPLLARLPAPPGRDAALEAFGAHESRQQAATPGMVYSELLAVVHGRLATLWGAAPDPAADAAFGASVPDWPAFPDSAEALAYLKQHFRLVILSNVDRTGFAASNRRLGVEFDLICTAQDVGSYKPDPANFDYLLDKLAGLGFGRADILHTAQSLFHDHVPATEAGLACAWIDRRQGLAGWGATPPPPKEARIVFHFPGMAALVEAHRAELRAEG